MDHIFARKIGMTRVFTDKGQSVPVTVLQAEGNTIFQLKNMETDGYCAVQVGIGEQKIQRVSKALRGHFAKAEKGIPSFVGEIRCPESELSGLQVGGEISINEMFAVGSKVDVRGTSIGKGYAGVMKRHGMRGQPATHGTHEFFRHGGSIGNRKFPGRVFKNKRMSGRMGGLRVLQQGLEVVEVIADDNLLLLKGSVPGPKNGIVLVRQNSAYTKPKG